MSLSKTLYPLFSAGSTQKDPSRHDCKIVDWDIQNQNKQNFVQKEHVITAKCFLRSEKMCFKVEETAFSSAKYFDSFKKFAVSSESTFLVIRADCFA